jgi:hypothetical protein
VERMLSALCSYSKAGAAVPFGQNASNGEINDSADKLRTASAVPGLQAALDRWCTGLYTELDEHPCRIR